VPWFNDPEVKRDELKSKHDIDLDAEAKEKLTTAITYAVEKMDEKVNAHLMETVQDVSGQVAIS
jgi:hypothetical protein